MIRHPIITAVTILSMFFFSGCGSRSPLDEISKTLKGVPTYSVILEDMQEEGSLFKSYHHKYQILIEEKTTTTRWARVSESIYRKYLPFLGMTIWVKKDGKESASIGPPGYSYVGNNRYGQWQTGSSGRSFWVFYGQYRLLSDFLGPGRMYRNQYNTYQDYRSRGVPYHGPNKEYGTNGSMTKRQKPNFYSRRVARTQQRQSSFSDRVNKRVGRSRSGTRSRSSGWGK